MCYRITTKFVSRFRWCWLEGGHAFFFERIGWSKALAIIHTHTCVLPKGLEPKFFQLKYNPLTFEYKIHSVEVDIISSIYKPKINVLNTFCPSIKRRKMDGQK